MITFENFVLQHENFFSANECEQFIDSFHRMDRAGFTISRQKQSPDTPSTIKKDDQYYITDVVSGKEMDVADIAPCRMFQEKFWNVAFPTYTQEYGILEGHARITIRSMKIQKTEIAGGYHVWHCEDAAPEVMRRVLTFILYLNDVDEGGETEFLYYPKRIKAKQGRLVLWPAGFTHTHRGNPPLTGTKYILTGWVDLA